MRNRTIYIFAALLTSALALSCTKITPTLDGEQRPVIGYNVVTSGEGQTPTKAASAFPTSESFISSAYAIASSQNWDDNSSSATKFFNTEAEEVKWQGTYWSTDNQYYWSAEKKLTFFSYAPSSLKDKGVSITREGVGASGWDALGEHKDIALLVADIAKDKTKNENYAGFNGVPTHFQNKLCKLTFRFAASDLVDAGTEVYLTEATMSGFYTKGDYAKGGTGAESWSNLSGQQTEYVLFRNDAGEKLSSTFIVKEMIMIPQSTSGISLSISYKTKTGELVTPKEPVILSMPDDFRSGKWGKGEHITYTMKIGAGRIPILFNGSAEIWKHKDGGTIEIK